MNPAGKKNSEAVFLSLTPLCEAPFSKLVGNYGDSQGPVMCSLCRRLRASFTGTADGHTPSANPCDTGSQLCRGGIRWWLSATARLHFRGAAPKNQGLKGEAATWHWRQRVLLEEWFKGSWFTKGNKKCWRFAPFLRHSAKNGTVVTQRQGFST